MKKEEFLNIVQKMIADGVLKQEDAAKYLPELADNEDEKIRNELIRAFKSLNTIKVWNGIERTDILAWLEKLGKQEPVVIKEGCWYLCIKSCQYLGGNQHCFEEGKVYFSEKDGFLRSNENNIIYVYDIKHWESYFAPYEQKPVEWTEVEINMIDNAIAACQQCHLKTTAKWFESLKFNRPFGLRWKPTKEQLEAFASALSSYDAHCGSDPLYYVVAELYEQLKTL